MIIEFISGVLFGMMISMVVAFVLPLVSPKYRQFIKEDATT